MQGQKAILILNDLEKSHRLGNRQQVTGNPKINNKPGTQNLY